MINKIYKSVLITGASSGIGLETLKRFFKENIKIYALDKDISKLERLKRKHNFNIIQMNLFDTNEIYNIHLEYNFYVKRISASASTPYGSSFSGSVIMPLWLKIQDQNQNATYSKFLKPDMIINPNITSSAISEQ